jgi:hypothetical protein
MKTNMKSSKNAKQPDLEVNNDRRRFSKLVALSPALMTLTSRTALGSVYQCTVSGMQSGDLSGHHTQTYNCGVGFSPGGWWQNADKTGSSDGNIDQWIAAGVNPFTIGKKSDGTKYYLKDGTQVTGTTASTIYNKIKGKFGYNAPATSFDAIFGGSGGGSMWDSVGDNMPSNLVKHAAADYLNAALNQSTGQFSSVYDTIKPSDIVGLYQLATGTLSSFTTSTGTTVDSSFDVLNYFIMLHH